MVRIVRKGQERELSRLLALRQSNTRLPNAVERQSASVQFGSLTVGDSAKLPESLRPRFELEPDLEPRRRGPARLARRTDALVRRARRRDTYPRSLPRADAPTALLGLAPELAEPARARAGDLVDLCRTLAEVLDGLGAFARALQSLPADPLAVTEVLAGGGGRADQAPAPTDSGAAPRAGYPDGLTRREVEVLVLVAEGRTSKEIAVELCVVVPTVSRHLANIYTKIDARGRADATRYVFERLNDELVAR